MRMLAKDLKPGYFLVGDGRTRLYIGDVTKADGVVTLHHSLGYRQFTLDFDENDEVDAARPMEPRILPSDL